MRWHLLLTWYLFTVKNNFNIVAPFYDSLAKLVFGYQLELAQRSFLDDIKAGSKVLIVGGGTGKIIEWLPSDSNLQVDYVELSDAMISRAEQRNLKDNHVSFCAQDILETSGSYDVIITNFFLDCFDGDKLDAIIAHVNSSLKVGGQWLVTDFAPPTNARQRILLWAMHTFFQLVTRLESKGLQDIKGRLVAFGLKLSMEAFFSKQMIFSALFRKD